MKANHLAMASAALLLLAGPARAEWSSCLSGLRNTAAGAGVGQQTIASATDGLEPNDAVSFMDKQPEFTTPVWDYVAGLVDEERVEEGRVHAAKVWAAPCTPRRAATASIRRRWSRCGASSSDFGKSFGKRPVVQSLATLACEAPRRNDYWRKEFVAALKILRRRRHRSEEFMGSWAGAFGHTQFMPSTFLGTAVDLDGDGRRNIASSAADSLGSTANFLRKAGWRSGERWGFEVRLPDSYSGPSGRTGRQPMSFWAVARDHATRRQRTRRAERRGCCCRRDAMARPFW